ncbi:MAG: phage coat protein, partial [Ruminococcus sp.]|nr:phage coat protein [Ruminococcus sp.]
MAEIFNEKNFNGEIFTKYVQSLESVKKKELLRSKAIVRRQDIAPMFSEQNGGNYATTVIAGRIGGSAQNYDGGTDITSSGIGNYTQSRMVVGRANAWTERDFTADITGKDYMDVIGAQVADYWEDVDQQLILSVLKGIFSMNSGAANTEFVEKHTYDISGTDSPMFGLTTLNTALQKALGDRKSKFSLAIMHSTVATRLE